MNRAQRRVGEGLGVFRGGDGGLRIQQFHQALGGPGCPLQIADDFGQGAGGAGHHDSVKHECRQLAAGHGPGHHILGADPQHQIHGSEHDQNDRDGQPAAGHHLAHGRAERVLHRFRKAGAVQVFVVEGLDGLDRVQAFARVGANIGDAVLGGPGHFAHHPAKDQHRNEDEGQEQEHQPSQFGTCERQRPGATHENQKIAQSNGDAGADDRLNEGGVGGQPRHHFTSAGDFEKLQRQADNPGVDSGPDIGHDSFAQPRNQIVAHECGLGQNQDHTEHRQKNKKSRRPALLGSNPWSTTRRKAWPIPKVAAAATTKANPAPTISQG